MSCPPCVEEVAEALWENEWQDIADAMNNAAMNHMRTPCAHAHEYPFTQSWTMQTEPSDSESELDEFHGLGCDKFVQDARSKMQISFLYFGGACPWDISPPPKCFGA